MALKAWRETKHDSARLRRQAYDRQAVAEGLNDQYEMLVAEVMPVLLSVAATLEPVWLREARAAYYRLDDQDWGYLDWRLERDIARAEREYAEAMSRMDDDGGPVYKDWWLVSWGLV